MGVFTSAKPGRIFEKVLQVSDLEELRRKIDQTDEQLVRLMNERAKIVKEDKRSKL